MISGTLLNAWAVTVSHSGCGSLSVAFLGSPKYFSRNFRARSCPPNPNAIASPNIVAPNTIENAAITVCLANPSSSSVIVIARIQITKRIDQLRILAEA